ncbi:diguanylate cyclase (GGDEF)-like protein [Sphaerotilus hippei]|uniref:Diguanylate cyclase (GGDEF)-like protein n=1 Tax=Sphaerotilus hippei TaxID=744406 RepID=A0A318H791_9BURK|nr:EAL domain-containing protein [Sphaerotilus hippei]PXW95481.1 diguanylate cyclase (GGDEF)-like protein [Sphaerotilus hippei]
MDRSDPGVTPMRSPLARALGRARAGLHAAGTALRGHARSGAQPWAVASAVVALVIGLADPLLHRAEWLTFDLVMQAAARVQAARGPVQPQVIVAIDDASLQSLGRWPWPREVHARLIDRLHDAGSAAIGYDVMFSEPGTEPGDAALAAAVARHGRVVMPVSSARLGPTLDLSALLPLPALAGAAAGLGHTRLEPDADARVRRLHLEQRLGTGSWEAMPLVLARVQRASERAGRRAEDLPPWGAEPRMGTDAPWPAAVGGPGREVMLPGGQTEVRQVSAVQVLNDPQLAPALRGAVIWVGVTAQGLGHTIATPAATEGRLWSGVQWQAQVFEALQQARLIRPLDEPWCHAINLLPLLLLAGRQVACGRRCRFISPWMLPLPVLGSALALALFAVWVPAVGLSLGLALGWLLTRARDLSTARLALQRERGQADATLQAITDSVITVDTGGRVQYLNPSAERLVGCEPGVRRGQAVGDLLDWDPADARTLAQALAECLHEQRVVEVGPPLRLHGPSGLRLVRLIASPILASQRELGRHAGVAGLRWRGHDPVTGAVLALSDVTETRRAADRLQHEATHDALTGLPNRALLSERLQRAVQAAQAGGGGVALLFIDLDHFKRINDSLGHRHGDSVLKVVAERLQQCCLPHDTLARWGGDEFVALLEGVSGRDAVAARAAQMIESVKREFAIDQVEVACGCSIGIVMAPQDGTSVDSLLAMADTAMYRGKANGGKRHEFYASEMPAWTREWLALETRLRHGLDERSFVLHYQPQVDLRSGQLVGLEALLRWRQPDGELWSPARFLPATEENGLILEIGEWVIREATGQLARWRDQGLPLVPVSVNVSTRQCLDRRLVRVVADALRTSAVPAALLKLEVTESTAMADLGHLCALLGELRALGVQVAMDDFGTGFSSLSHLKNLRVDQIKIDPSFVRDISLDPNGAAIVRATIALAHGLGLPVVAEGVESREQMQFLTDHHCDIAQGYLYACAQDSHSVADLLRLSLATGIPLQTSTWRSSESMPVEAIVPA